MTLSATYSIFLLQFFNIYSDYLNFIFFYLCRIKNIQLLITFIIATYSTGILSSRVIIPFAFTFLLFLLFILYLSVTHTCIYKFWYMSLYIFKKQRFNFEITKTFFPFSLSHYIWINNFKMEQIDLNILGGFAL